MSDSCYGAVTRYRHNLDVIDQAWREDQISEAEIEKDWVTEILNSEDIGLHEPPPEAATEADELRETGLQQLLRDAEQPPQ